MIKKLNQVSQLRLMQLIILTALSELIRLCDVLNLNFYCIAGTLLGAFRHGGFIPWDSDLDVAMMREDYEIFIKKANEHIDDRFIVQSNFNDKNNRTSFARIRVKNTIINEKNNMLDHNFSGFYVDIFPIDNIVKKPGVIDIVFHKFIKILIRIKAYKGGKKYSSSKFRSLLGFLLNVAFFLVSKEVLDNYIEKYMKKHNSYDTNLVTNFNSKYGIKKQTMNKLIYGVPRKYQFEGIEIPIPNKSEFWLNKIYGDYMKIPSVSNKFTERIFSAYDIDFGSYDNLIYENESHIREILELPLKTLEK